MTPNLEHFLRGLGTVLAFAIVTYLANAANLSPLVGDSAATIIAGLAAMFDKQFSPDGTTLFGAIGKPRY